MQVPTYLYVHSCRRMEGRNSLTFWKCGQTTGGIRISNSTTQPPTVVRKKTEAQSEHVRTCCMHALARFGTNLHARSRCLVAKFLHWSPVGSLPRVDCWLGSTCSSTIFPDGWLGNRAEIGGRGGRDWREWRKGGALIINSSSQPPSPFLPVKREGWDA